jgi:orotate phosphoribosyltransferase
MPITPPELTNPSLVAQQVTNLLQQHQGCYVGHTHFRNGNHSDGWIEKGCLIRHPSSLELMTKFQSLQISQYFPQVQLLIGAPLCGVIVASSVARHLDLNLAVTVKQSNKILFHRMNVPMQGIKAVLVEDMICSGNDVREHIQFFEEFDIELLGVSSWINRQPNRIAGYLIISLLPAPFQNYSESDCPMCLENIPIQYIDIRE